MGRLTPARASRLALMCLAKKSRANIEGGGWALAVIISLVGYVSGLCLPSASFEASCVNQACVSSEDHRLQALTFCWQIEIVRDVTTIAALIPLRPQPTGLHRTTLTPERPIGLSG